MKNRPNLPGIDNADVIPSWPHVCRENSSKPITMKMHVVNLLQQLKNTGAAWQRMVVGTQVLEDLAEYITPEEHIELTTARGHYITGEGRNELDSICNRLIQKYRADVPPRTFGRIIL